MATKPKDAPGFQTSKAHHSAPVPAQKTKPKSTALPAEGFARLPTILANFPVSKSGWWAGVKSGRYPSPVKLGPRITAWHVEDIRKLIADAGNAANDAQA